MRATWDARVRNELGAFGGLGLKRREALWQVAEVASRRGPLLANLPPEKSSPLPEMTPFDETVADYKSEWYECHNCQMRVEL